MFREMRKKNKEMNKDEITEVLLNGEFGILSTIDENGYPYGVPLNYAYKNGFIYFHCAKTGHKTDNIMKNNKVSFCITESSEILPEKFTTMYKSVILFGKAVEAEGEEKKDGLLALIEKYSADFMDEGKKYIERAHDTARVLKIEIEHSTGKVSK
ncbi:MAG TPA: MFS transporter [Clostridiales bacterium]|nr:MFS transporter [Clostridiales bacterium]